MTVFLQGKNALSIWNKQKEKIISFQKGKYETEDDFEISLLKKEGYKQVKETDEKKFVKETKKVEETKPVKGKPGRPKAK